MAISTIDDNCFGFCSFLTLRTRHVGSPRASSLSHFCLSLQSLSNRVAAPIAGIIRLQSVSLSSEKLVVTIKDSFRRKSL